MNARILQARENYSQAGNSFRCHCECWDIADKRKSSSHAGDVFRWPCEWWDIAGKKIDLPSSMFSVALISAENLQARRMTHCLETFVIAFVSGVTSQAKR